jgi:hypothetical protein
VHLVRFPWIWLVLLCSVALGCEAIASFDRDKLGQQSALPPMLRRDGGVRTDAGRRDASEEEEPDASEEEPDASEEELDASEEELDASESGLDAETAGDAQAADAGQAADADAGAEGDGALDGAPSAEAAVDAAPDEAGGDG